MKKTMILALAALVAGSALAAESYSKNAVGFIKTSCTAGELTALSIPFYGTDSDAGGTAFTNTAIATDAAVGSKVYFWNGTGWDVGEYTSGRTGASWSATAKAKTIIPGELFLYSPAEDQDAIVGGEVPDDATITLGITGGGALSALGLPYPVECAWTNTELAASAVVGAKAYFWNGTGWDVGEYTSGRTGAAWSATAKAKTLAPGEGFLYSLPSSAEDTTVDAVRPYDWPAAE